MLKLYRVLAKVITCFLQIFQKYMLLYLKFELLLIQVLQFLRQAV